MIKYILHYSDKSNIQQLEIEIINDFEFINNSYPIEDSEAKKIYLFLNSDNKKEIQEYLSELIQNDDVPNLSQLSQRGEI
jgi:hypothetical protein